MTDEIPEGFQKCRGICGKVKPLDEFYVDNSRKCGKTTRCQECCSADSKTYRERKIEEDPTWRQTRFIPWHSQNQDKLAGYRKAWLDADEDRWRTQNLEWKFGITLERYRSWLSDQGDACGICGTLDPGGRSGEWFQCDHDHSCCEEVPACGKCTRGIVCNRCNTYVIPVYEGKKNGNIDDLWVYVHAYMLDYAERRATLDTAS